MFITDQNLEKGLLSTLSFFGVYGIPISAEKAYKFLYKARGNREEVEATLKKLASVGRIYEGNGLYALQSWQEASTKEREWEVKKRQKKVKKFLWLLSILPFVKQLSIINSLSLEASKQESDIDFFVVTSPHLLYFTRTIIILILRALGLYKTKDKIREQFCFGFFITADNVDIQKILLEPEDPYTAFWLASMQPLFGKKYYANFASQNNWIFEYLPNFNPIFYYDRFVIKPKTRFIKYFLEIILFIPALILEPILRFIHIRHTFSLPENHWPTATTVANAKMLKLHAKDRRQKVREDFYSSLSSLGV